MRRLFLLIVVCIFAFSIKAQQYGNEWISYSQQYFKLPVVREGIYRIDSTVLSNYYNLSSTDPRNFQVFIKGKEQFLFVNGESDGKINTGDYLEFYADPYMGDIDSLVYTDIQYMPNPYRALYNDTLYAFLTLNTSLSNKRYILETDTSSAGYPVADHFYTEKVFSFSNSYNPVISFSGIVSDPRLTQAEGRGSVIFKGGTQTLPVSGLNTYTSSPKDFYISLNYSGMSQSLNTNPDHQVQTLYSDQNNNQVLLKDTVFYGYAPVRQRFNLNAQNTNDFTAVTLSSVASPSLSSIANQTMLHYVHYFYPHTLDLNNTSFFKLHLDNAGSSTKSFFKFSNFNMTGSGSVIMLDISNGKRITTVISGSQLRALVPNGAGKKICILAAENDTIAVPALRKVNQNGNFISYKDLSAGKPYVIIYHGSLKTSATEYKNYRQSAAGGGYDVIDADIGALYEQFSYGINKHPLAIRNFIKFLKDSLPNPPAYVFLIGKGVNFTNLSPTYQFANLIPTMGVPSSDNLLTAALTASNTNTGYPEIPIGRLAVFTNSEVSAYLSKIQQHESSQLQDWKKRVLHFVGGDDEALSNTLSGYMSTYEQIIKDTLYGGDVYTFRKNTTAPVQINISDSIKSMIKYGAGIFNFFGHGSKQGFDQAIDEPETYNNTGRYPLVIANSCYSGDIHDPGLKSISERFVLANQKGSIGFIAATAYGVDYALHNYTYGFYKALSVSRYNQGIGDIIKETVFQNSTGDILSKFVALDMTLHGDPALKVSSGVLPDYQVYNNDVSFDLKKYTDSVGVIIKHKNLGKAIRDSFAVRIERFFPNGDSLTVLKYIAAPMYKDSLKLYIPLDFNRGIGLNHFRVKLDHYERIQEVSENNNATVGNVDLFIPGGDILPVYPYKYAVVPKTTTLVLKASTTDPFAPHTTYRFQLDTCDKFTSLLTTTLISSKGGVLEWKVDLPYKDSTVYYWRVSRDSVSPLKSFAWRESSFQTIGDKRGWSQAHFDQFKNDSYQFVNYKKQERKFVFGNNHHSIKCRTGVHPYLHHSLMNYFFDTQIKEAWSCTFNGWNFAVFDSITGQPQYALSLSYPAPGAGAYNNCVCKANAGRYVYSFGSVSECTFTANWKADVENFLNAVAPNNYVLAYTTGYIGPNYSEVSSYSNSLYNAFESIGAKNIRTTPDTVAYVMFGRKGMTAGQAHVLIGTNKQTILDLEDSIQTRWHNGYVASEQIGPSYKWNSLHWRVKSLESTAGDTTLLKVIGIRANGQIDTLHTFVEDSSDVLALYNYVDATVYPYLKLVAFMRDNVHRTSPQLKRWQVLYDEAPECAINPLKGFASINDTLTEGDEVTFRFPIENIGIKNFEDSLVITYWIENNERIRYPLPQRMKPAPFAPGQVLVDTIKVNTYQFKGNNALWIYVNPIQNSKYQKEQSQFNNIGRYAFKVSKDITNPLLDVTFDGVRILNGDIVSARPDILITLKDENRFLALNDTSAFTVLIQAPDQPLQQRLYFGKDLQFVPADLPRNSCSIHYNPKFEVDGKYTLIAQARDRSMNVSGSQDYRIQFEIQTKPSVTHVLNYPNPFSTSTKFVFTLTGSEVPEVFTIQIMTITGKIVREITRAELGHLHIGRNITDYAWDGRDNYGDRLANGVYLYRVITKLNGENIERNVSGADKFFVKDFGKMVLMR